MEFFLWSFLASVGLTSAVAFYVWRGDEPLDNDDIILKNAEEFRRDFD